MYFSYMIPTGLSEGPSKGPARACIKPSRNLVNKLDNIKYNYPLIDFFVRFTSTLVSLRCMYMKGSFTITFDIEVCLG